MKVFPTGAASDSNITTLSGAAGSGLSQPSGGSGLMGFLSGIYAALLGLLSTASLLDTRVRNGQAFIYSTGPISILTLATNLRVLFTNPNASGKTAYIYAIVIENSLSTVVSATIYVTPTTGLPTTSATVCGQKIGGNSTVCTFKADGSATALSGGTAMLSFGVPPVRTVFSEGLICVPANNTLGIAIPFGAIATGNVIIYGYEE